MKYGRIILAATLLATSPAVDAADVTAFAEPYRDIDVAASETGTIARIDVKEGDQVTAGQLLGGLDEDVLLASLRIAETAVNARGKLNSVLAELRLQTDRLDKLIALRDRQHASQEEVDRTRAQKDISAANLEVVHDELKLRSIECQRIEAELRHRRVVSPIDGVVSAVYKDVGEFVSATDPIVVKVVQLDPLLAIFSVPVEAANSLQVDTPIAVIVGDSQQPVTGSIEFISPTADAQSGTVRVKIRIPNPDRQLQSGTPCSLRLPDRSPEMAMNSAVAPTISRRGQTRDVTFQQGHLRP